MNRKSEPSIWDASTFLQVEAPEIHNGSILGGFRGSVAHGMWAAPTEPTSIDDIDLMLVCVPPPEYYLGLKEFGSRGTKETRKDQWDVVAYEAKKFISLLEKGNPNVLAMLWMLPEHYFPMGRSGGLLLDNRNLFVGRHVFHSFTGYAYGQLHRMTHMKFEGYMGEKRKALVERFGFDAKNGAHLIRLLRMGIEFLQTGELQVHRKDASELLEIKHGLWTLERVKEEAERLFGQAEGAYANSKLPTGPNHEKISQLCELVIRSAWEEQGYARP